MRSVGEKERPPVEGWKPDVIQLLIVNCYAGLSEREFRKWARINANNRVCHSERHPLSFRTQWGISRGRGKRFFAYALNDKLMVNCQWLIVMRGTRRIMYLENNHWPFISAFVLGPRAVSRRSSEQGERKSGCPKRSELPDFPTCERRDDVRSARSLDLLVTFGSSQ